MTLSELQLEVSDWSNKNFPNNKPHSALLGVFEELGELTEADLFTRVGDNRNQEKEVLDAIADTVIYLADYCSRNDISLEECFNIPVTFSETYDPENMMILLGKFSHAHLKKEQGIRTNQNHLNNIKTSISGILHSLMNLTEEMDVDFFENINEIWSKVKQRNWQVNKVTG